MRDDDAAMTVRFLLVARLPAGGLTDFDAYESAVLPLLAEHGGRLERRLRARDGRGEAHVVAFPDEDAFAAYRADPRREAATPLLRSSGAELDLWPVDDLPT